MYTTTTSAMVPALAIKARAAGRSSSEAVLAYGANPRNATVRCDARITVICPGRPVWATPAPFSACSVSARPGAPKSYEWLLALFTIVNPARRRYCAYDGGTLNAKHTGEGEGDGERRGDDEPDGDGDRAEVGGGGHFEYPPSVR